MPTRPKFHKPSSTVKQVDEAKAERDRFYTGAAWRRCRKYFLIANPICVDCEADGELVQATTPHHVLERLNRPDLSYDWENLVALCQTCHAKRHNPKGST